MTRTPIALFISDIHLGTPQCKAEMLLEFLKKYQNIQSLYLVGDIIDVWALSNKVHWPATHNTVIQKILRMSRHGVHVTYVLGNHDEAIRDMLPLKIGDINILNEAVYYDFSNRKILVVHGDEFDGVIKKYKLLYFLGDAAYSITLSLNSILNRVRKFFGFEYWSLSAFLKRQVKEALQHINNYENLVVGKAEKNVANIVICGHIHTPNIKQLKDVVYVNDGDWCESCTGAVLYDNGDIEIVKHTGEVIHAYIKNKQ